MSLLLDVRPGATDQNFRDLIRGKRILVVGGDPRHGEYERHIKKSGGIFVGLAGDIACGNQDKLAREIKKADGVMLIIRMIKHQTSGDAMDMCRCFKKPYAEIKVMGIQSLLLGIESALTPRQK